MVSASDRMTAILRTARSPEAARDAMQREGWRVSTEQAAALLRVMGNVHGKDGE